jgi:transcription elongation factor Elf1
VSCPLCGHSKDVHEEYDKDPATDIPVIHCKICGCNGIDPQ